jgi:hypothetical protein
MPRREISLVDFSATRSLSVSYAFAQGAPPAVPPTSIMENTTAASLAAFA